MLHKELVVSGFSSPWLPLAQTRSALRKVDCMQRKLSSTAGGIDGDQQYYARVTVQTPLQGHRNHAAAHRSLLYCIYGAVQGKAARTSSRALPFIDFLEL